jgi:hypothetical protein
MKGLSSIIDRMIAAGVSPGEAGAIAAEIFAAGVASASTRSPGAERTRRWREKQASQSDGLRHETSHGDGEKKASPNVTDRHKASQSDGNAVLPIDTKIKNSKKQNSDRPSRGSRIDPNWTPSDADRLAASQEGLSESEITREALRFRDFWTSKAGAGGVKLDWAATWRNWVRTTAERLGKTPANPSAPAVLNGFYAKFGSEEQDAWDRFGKATANKTFPRDKNGGWNFPARWPPGYEPQQARNTPSVPNLKGMQ